jgi:hypothetical protein
MKLVIDEGNCKIPWAMKIKLNLDAKPLKRRLYFLKPKYKDKVHRELKQMLNVRINFPMEETEWISLMVVQPMKTCEI